MTGPCPSGPVVRSGLPWDMRTDSGKDWGQRYLGSDHHTDRYVRTVVGYETHTGFTYPGILPPLTLLPFIVFTRKPFCWQDIIHHICHVPVLAHCPADMSFCFGGLSSLTKLISLHCTFSQMLKIIIHT